VVKTENSAAILPLPPCSLLLLALLLHHHHHAKTSEKGGREEVKAVPQQPLSIAPAWPRKRLTGKRSRIWR